MAAGVVGILAAVGAPSAFAQVGLPGLIQQGTDPVTQAVGQVNETVAQALPSSTPPAADTSAPGLLETATQSVNRAVDSAQKTADGAVATANQAAGSAAGTAQKTVDSAQTAIDDTAGANPVLAPVVDTAQRTVDTAQKAVDETVATANETVGAVVQTAQTTVDSGQLVLDDTAATADDILGGTGAALTRAGPLLGSVLAPGTRAAALPAGTQPHTATGPPATPPLNELSAAAPQTSGAGTTPRWTAASTAVSAPRLTPNDSQTPNAPPPGVSFPSSASVGGPDGTQLGGVAMPSSHSHAPLPDIPSGPLTALLSASASGGGGALAFLLATLVAALSLAAPGLSRRLRLTLAPWPQPTPHLSLERPG